MTGRLTARPRVAVLLPFTADWQAVVPYDLAADRRRLLDTAVAALGPEVEVVEACVVASEQEAAVAAGRGRDAGAEAVVVLAAMAVLPSVAMAAIAHLPGCPVVIWCVVQTDELPAAVGHAEVVADGGTVGAPMITSLLVRAGVPFELVVGRADAAATIAEVVGATCVAAAARRISTARVGRVGRATAGYGTVSLDEERLQTALGITVVDIAPAVLARCYRDVADDVVRVTAAEIRSAYAVATTVDAEDLDRAARADAALAALVAEYDLDAGALNCHVPGIRFPPGLGFAPCFALGRATSRGVPWSCSTDVPAVVAMLALKAVGAAAQYHELGLLAASSGELLVTSSGEHDLGFSAETRPALVRNAWFPHDTHASLCVRCGPPAGPATLLGFAQLDTPGAGHRFVLARGAFVERSFPSLGMPSAAFRFAAEPPADAWGRWARGGVGLHTACSPGDHERSIAAVARLLRAECIVV